MRPTILFSALSGSAFSQTAGDLFLAQSFSPSHLDPAVTVDPSRSHLLAVNGGDGDGGGDPPSSGERWYRGLESKIFASPSVISGRLGVLLKNWPDLETHREIQALDRNGVREVLTGLTQARLSTIPSRMKALSALVAVEGIAAAVPLIPALHEMWLLERLEGLGTIERDEFLDFMGFGRLTVFLDADLDDGIGPEVIGLMAGAEMLLNGLDFVPFGTPSGMRMDTLRTLGNLLLLGLDLREEARSGVDPKRLERISVWEPRHVSERMEKRENFSSDMRTFTDKEIGTVERERAQHRKRKLLILSFLQDWPARESADYLVKRLGESGASTLEGIIWDSRCTWPVRSKALSALLLLGKPSLTISSKLPIVESLLSITAPSLDSESMALRASLFMVREALNVLSDKEPATLRQVQGGPADDSLALFRLARVCLLEDLVFKLAETFRDLRERGSDEERRETEGLWETLRNRMKAEEEGE